MSDLVIGILGGLSSVGATLVASFAGGGASFILFPLLLEFSGLAYASVLTATKVSAFVMTVVSGKLHMKRHTLNWGLFWALVIPGLIGTAVGTYLVQYQLNEDLFKLILGITLFSLASYLLFAKKMGVKGGNERKIDVCVLVISAVFSFAISVLNGLFGGTGILATIYFVTFLRMSFIRAVAYTMAISVVINFFQAGYLLLTEPVPFYFVAVLVAGAIIGSYLGTHLQYLKGNLWVKRIAILMMLLLSLNIFYGLFV